MTKQIINPDLGQDKILNLDADAPDNFIAYTQGKAIITNDQKVTVSITIPFPFIRRLNNETFLIADGRTGGSQNGHIYNFSGGQLKPFFLGDGIHDIVVHYQKIIVIYFDEGVMGAAGPNNDGLAVFDFEGKQLFGFNSSAIRGQMLDCYCICKHGTNRVLFYAYDALKVYELNLQTLAVEAYETPNDFAGASAISSKEGQIILHSSYNHNEKFFAWDRSNNLVTEIGSYAGKLKGIKNGKFLAFGDKEFTVVDPTAERRQYL